MPISAETHRTFLHTADADAVRDRGSFLQCPSWAQVKANWEAEHLGWLTPAGTIVGAALVLHRTLPRTAWRLAYIPEGPVIDWNDPDLARWLLPLQAYLRSRHVFAVKIGPPVPLRTWSARTLHAAVTDGSAGQVGAVPADATDEVGMRVARQLTELGWRRGGLRSTERGDVQPSLVFEVPLAAAGGDELWRNLGQQWRRNITKAQRSGVEVVVGGYDDLPAFHELLQTTQQRDGFDLGRSLGYFQRQYKALTAEDPDRMRLYLAVCDGEILAAHIMTVLGRRAWYLYGASASHRREVRPSHALQWRMIQDAHELGCHVYDMRGFTDTLNAADPAFGLLRWKLGTGGRAVQYLGEWDLPLSRPLYAAARLYLARRRR